MIFNQGEKITFFQPLQPYLPSLCPENREFVNYGKVGSDPEKAKTQPGGLHESARLIRDYCCRIRDGMKMRFS